MEIIARTEAILGEGPVWIAGEQALYWVDIVGAKLFRWSESEGTQTIVPARRLCSLLPRASGGFIAGGDGGFLTVAADWSIAPIADPEVDLPGNRFNDGKIDRHGRMWAGTMDNAEASASGSLYRLDPDLAWQRIDTGYRVTNGPAFSLDGRTMYHTDSALQTIYAFDLDRGGGASNRRIFARFGAGEGYPDGMTVDAEDCLWIAFWDGWCVRRYSPQGERLTEVGLPVRCPTSCAFGGEHLDRLFITSATRDLDHSERASQPAAGGLIRIDAGVCGPAERSFAG